MAISPPPAHIESSAPGRICLFGEHQDYLRLPVIAMAVDLRVTITGKRRADPQMHLTLTDIGETFEFNPNEPFPYRHNRDYIPAAANVLARLHGVRWPAGYDIEITGRIPINAGASSSSALQIAWTAFLLAAAGDSRATDPEFVAHVAQFSEVGEFGSPGGMMDHYSSALGGVVYLDCLDPIGWERLPGTIGPFVLIDSGTPKATNEVLGRVRHGVEAAAKAAGIDLHAANDPSPLLNVDATKLPPPEDAEQGAMLRAALRNRDITHEARAAMLAGATPVEIGRLLDAHHEQLAHGLGISTDRIDALLDSARAAGATGGKINGSGGGGSCFALAPDNADAVAEAIRAQGRRADVVRPGEGLRVITQP
ncbi:GHMP kinase [candidate division BRC1 bacterium HGW-BRC1-1]|jgi:galactokinase|nr:MAG: GHMP kinase [candidate division BRC1 bacterium HGW-BRC1-1]